MRNLPVTVTDLRDGLPLLGLESLMRDAKLMRANNLRVGHHYPLRRTNEVLGPKERMSDDTFHVLNICRRVNIDP